MSFWKLVGALLVAWLVISLLGWLLKSLLWFAIIGGLIFAGVAIYNWSKKQVNS
jgi:hypothetical protein